MKCPSQKPAHAKAKRAGAGSRRKRNYRSVRGATHPKICIRISRVPCPGNILPTQHHVDYAKMLNKNKRTINGVEFAKMNDYECLTLIPFSSHSTRDNSYF
jgi:hypothetical protein